MELSRTKHGGFSLVELLMVVLVLGIVAVIVMPHLGSSAQSRVELAALEVASAIRFAREEARRNGQPTLVEFSGKARVRVAEIDVSGPMPALGPKLRHPLSGHAYDLDLHAQGLTAGVLLVTGLPGGPPGTANSIGFDARGEPRKAVDMTPIGTSDIKLALGDISRTVRIAAVTGRVTEP